MFELFYKNSAFVRWQTVLILLLLISVVHLGESELVSCLLLPLSQCSVHLAQLVHGGVWGWWDEVGETSGRWMLMVVAPHFCIRAQWSGGLWVWLHPLRLVAAPQCCGTQDGKKTGSETGVYFEWQCNTKRDLTLLSISSFDNHFTEKTCITTL